MRITRFEHNGAVHRGTVSNGTIVTGSGRLDVDDVNLLPPCEPTKIVAVGRNYTEHIAEMNEGEVDLPDFPLLFHKPVSSIIGPNDPIVYPDSSNHLDHEGEVGLVMDGPCRDVTEAEAMEYVRGYTAVNDVSSRDWGDKEYQWFRSKGMDTFCPVGPFIQTEVPDDIAIEPRVNGEVRQSSSTDHLIFSIPELVAEISRFVTLEAGDLIATGTPSGVGEITPGDTVEITAEGAGTLTNEVV